MPNYSRAFGAILCIASVGLLPALAHAQAQAQAQQSSAPAAAPTDVTIPDPTCEQPPTHPMDAAHATGRDWDKLNKRIKEYQQCMSAYAQASKEKSDQYQAVASKYIEAGNKAINTFNDYINEVKKEQGAD